MKPTVAQYRALAVGSVKPLTSQLAMRIAPADAAARAAGFSKDGLAQ